MTENHYVDPKDQHIAAQGVPTRSELTTAYRNVEEKTLGPWMQENDRQAAMEKDRLKVITDLRKSSLLIGIALSVPVVTGILLYEFALVRANMDPSASIILAFVLLFAAAAWAIVTFRLFKWVSETFRQHTLRALPTSFTTLLMLVLLIRPVFMYFLPKYQGQWGGIYALSTLLVIGIVVSIIMIFVWTAKWIPALLKITFLLATLGASAAIAYLY